MRYLMIIVIVCVSSIAHAFELTFPVDCTIGENCYIQNYSDLDPLEGDDTYHDYRCNKLTYDTHKGIDIRLLHEKGIEDGIKVLAASDGMVKGLRNDVPDVNIRTGGRKAVKGKECGNGVIMTHEDGWTTQYCHLREGSVRVHKGEVVKAGDVLGLIGLSGMTEFPHLHFHLKKDGKVVDPFVGLVEPVTCGDLDAFKPLWHADAAKQVRYIPTGMLGTGFTSVKPTGDEVRAGEHRLEKLATTDPAIVFWIDAFGIHKEDVLHLSLKDTRGKIMAENNRTFERSKAQIFFLIGSRSKGLPWPAGNYTGEVKVTRGDAVVIDERYEIAVE